MSEQTPDPNSSKPKKDFASKAAEGGSANLATEFFEFLRDNKKWWLAPIIISVLGLGLLVMLGGGGAAPFIYTLF